MPVSPISAKYWPYHNEVQLCNVIYDLTCRGKDEPKVCVKLQHWLAVIPKYKSADMDYDSDFDLWNVNN